MSARSGVAGPTLPMAGIPMQIRFEQLGRVLGCLLACLLGCSPGGSGWEDLLFTEEAQTVEAPCSACRSCR